MGLAVLQVGTWSWLMRAASHRFSAGPPLRAPLARCLAKRYASQRVGGNLGEVAYSGG